MLTSPHGTLRQLAAAVQAAFSQFLSDESLSARQIRFVELIIDQLSQNGVIEPKALYEAPFSALHSEGPEALFAGKENVVEDLFGALEQSEPRVSGAATNHAGSRSA